MSNLNEEPSLDKIDDYNGKESKEKRRTTTIVIGALLFVGIVLTYFKVTSQPVDYVGTSENPGITNYKK